LPSCVARALASGISNSQIDQAVEDALAAGATGAKVT
jgi:galactokinase/mevalonate kinase-like predicted kinase